MGKAALSSGIRISGYRRANNHRIHNRDTVVGNFLRAPADIHGKARFRHTAYRTDERFHTVAVVKPFSDQKKGIPPCLPVFANASNTALLAQNNRTVDRKLVRKRSRDFQARFRLAELIGAILHLIARIETDGARHFARIKPFHKPASPKTADFDLPGRRARLPKPEAGGISDRRQNGCTAPGKAATRAKANHPPPCRPQTSQSAAAAESGRARYAYCPPYPS